MAITNFLVMNGAGTLLDADAYGTNVAFRCFSCGHPILASALEYQRGGGEDHPVECKGCNACYFLDVRLHIGKLYIHVVDKPGV